MPSGGSGGDGGAGGPGGEAWDGIVARTLPEMHKQGGPPKVSPYRIINKSYQSLPMKLYFCSS